MPRSEILIAFAAGFVLLLTSGCAGAATALAAHQLIEGGSASSKLLIDSIDGDRTLTMSQGETFELDVTRKYTPAPLIGSSVGLTETDDVTGDVEYQVEDSSIVTVTADGTVRALQPGRTDVTVLFNNSDIHKADQYDFTVVVEDDGDPQNDGGDGGDGNFGF